MSTSTQHGRISIRLPDGRVFEGTCHADWQYENGSWRTQTTVVLGDERDRAPAVAQCSARDAGMRCELVLDHAGPHLRGGLVWNDPPRKPDPQYVWVARLIAVNGAGDDFLSAIFKDEAAALEWRNADVASDGPQRRRVLTRMRVIE